MDRENDVLCLDNGVAKMRTRDALRRRELVTGFAVTNLGRIVRAALLTSEAEALAYAERKDAIKATERARTAEAERRGFSADEDHAFCAECAHAIRGHTPDRRPAACPGAVEPCDKRQDECEGMPILPFADWGTASRTWQDWVTHVRRYREAADMDEVHARALVENEVREVAQQLSTRYYVQRVNGSTFYAVVDADHQNRIVSGMTTDVDETKAWQRVAHRQWAEREVARRAGTAHDEDAEPPEQARAR